MKSLASVFYLAKFPKTHLHFKKGEDPVLLKSTTRYEGASVPMIVSVKLDEVEMCANAAAGNILLFLQTFYRVSQKKCNIALSR